MAQERKIIRAVIGLVKLDGNVYQEKIKQGNIEVVERDNILVSI